jgi:hypothetical protein
MPSADKHNIRNTFFLLSIIEKKFESKPWYMEGCDRYVLALSSWNLSESPTSPRSESKV